MTSRPHLVIVGGFLGAGKTTLILAAARVLADRGVRSVIILNDQGDSLVDTELARARGFESGEVTGGCFCCRFSDLIRVAEQLQDHSPQVIFAEPVGSCTDLSATILLPILDSYRDAFQLAPLTLLVDPQRSRRLEDPDIAFLFQKQLEEADIVCFTKSDINPHPPSLPGSRVRQLSARTGQGVAAWLDEILSGQIAMTGTILDIDYERYAQAEAALAWLNVEVDIVCEPPLSPAMLLGPLLDRLDCELTQAGIPIVHLKAFDQSGSGWLKAAICGNGAEPATEGALDASPAASHRLLINLRAGSAPEPVRAIVERALAGMNGALSNLRIQCFSPAAPKPERRVTPGAAPSLGLYGSHGGPGESSRTGQQLSGPRS
jgi:CobW/HypB/UreG, nucleotide-binding domain